MPATRRFRAVLEKADDSSATAVAMPFDVRKVFGTRARVPVWGTINGFTFRSSISPYGGIHYLPVNRALREGAGAKAGDTVSIVIERDEEPRVVTPPPDLARALATNKAAQAAWGSLSFTHQKEYARAVEEAKKPETRARRIAQTVTTLAARER